MVSVAYLIRLAGGVILALVAAFFLVNTENAHVTMCMLGAIGYGIGLSIPRRELAARMASVFFSWTAFYTVYTGTTFLAIEAAFGNTGLFDNADITLDQGWIYHTVINFALLMLFVLKLDRMAYVLAGFWSAMLAAPLMFVLAPLGRALWEVETPAMIVGYAVGGLALLGLDRSLRRKPLYATLLRLVRLVIIISLLIYAALTLAPYALDLVGFDANPAGIIEQDTETAANHAGRTVNNFQAADPSQIVIGYAGCSITYQTVEGYWMVGGRNMWPPERRYDDGSVMNWGNPHMPFQNVFDENLQKYPATKIIWWQLCLPSHEFPTYEHANEVITAIKARLPHAIIYVSSLAPYEHLCEGSGTTGISRGQQLAEELAARRADVKLGPAFSTLTVRDTENDLCHLEAPGKRKLGQELKEFFEKK